MQTCLDKSDSHQPHPPQLQVCHLSDKVTTNVGGACGAPRSFLDADWCLVTLLVAHRMAVW
jgi:hypothetical protein